MVRDGTLYQEKIVNYPPIILIRHGETQWNLEGRYQGQKDSPLTSKGKEQSLLNALKLAKKIKNLDEVSFFSSPLGRAKASALIICQILGIAEERIIFTKEISEFDYGIFEGELKSFCQTTYATEFKAREADKWYYEIEGGESYELVTQRLKRWLATLDPTKTVVIIAHEMVNRALRGVYLQLPHEKTLVLRQANSMVLMLQNCEEFLLT